MMSFMTMIALAGFAATMAVLEMSPDPQSLETQDAQYVGASMTHFLARHQAAVSYASDRREQTTSGLTLTSGPIPLTKLQEGHTATGIPYFRTSGLAFNFDNMIASVVQCVPAANVHEAPTTTACRDNDAVVFVLTYVDRSLARNRWRAVQSALLNEADMPLNAGFLYDAGSGLFKVRAPWARTLNYQGPGADTIKGTDDDVYAPTTDIPGIEVPAAIGLTAAQEGSVAVISMLNCLHC